MPGVPRWPSKDALILSKEVTLSLRSYGSEGMSTTHPPLARLHWLASSQGALEMNGFDQPKGQGCSNGKIAVYVYISVCIYIYVCIYI